MTDWNPPEESTSSRSLRKRAEELLGTRPADHPTLETEQVQALVHELNVHQIELEMQNEELLRAQTELAISRDQYAQLYDLAPFGYVTLNKGGTIEEANLTAATMLGVERAALVGANFSNFLTRDAADEFYLHLRHVFDSDHKKTCEIELAKADELASIIRIESLAFGPKGTPRCRTAMIDISYRKAAELIVRESEARLRRLNEELEKRVADQTREVQLLAEAVAHLGEGVLITEENLDWPGPRIVFVNEAMCRISGYEVSELIGKSPRILQGDRTDRTTLDRIKAALLNGNPYVAELINYRKDGTPYYAELFTTPLLDTDGRHTNFVSIHRDITERKRAEEELRKSHDLLEQRVKERTRALEEANKACESANAFKSRFLTAASHDLRQPLTAMELYLSVLANQLGRAEDHEVCEKIRVALNSMHELLDTLLDVSRLETGKILPANKDFALRELLARIVTGNHQQAAAKGLEMVCADTDCIVRSDPVLLERIIENLVANAIRYTDAGRITLDCRRGENTATISVADTGIGIPENALDSIFEEYCQLGNPTRDRRKGLGLGLSIVKQIARLLDHRIEVHSSPGEGSIFSIHVPLGDAPEPPGGSSLPEPRRCKADGARILVVDDEPSVLDAMTMLLKSSGFRVIAAASGEEAFASVETDLQPDLVLCDYRLPGGSGVEIIRRLRNRLGTDVPAVLLTGDTSLQQIKAENLWNCTVAHKPLASDQLIALIEKLIAR
ncbi:MAG: PAS domain-containing hybrid sensor histidine kinase/response regulator [Gammaproteobacteria bacterium]